MVEKIEYELIRSRRKTTSLQLLPDGKLILRAPMRASAKELDEWVESKRGWIEKHRRRMKEINPGEEDIIPFSEEEIGNLSELAIKDFPERAKRWAQIVGVSYGRITIRNQRSKWGSCSSKGNLNFNCILMLAPEEVRDYIVVHELCHRLEMNHSKRFWANVERVLPGYKEQEKWLKTEGRLLMERNRR